jgi:DNA-binding NarL/FixJ family response regulator
MITVLLVDDHSLVRRGFRRLLEDDPDIQVVGEAGNGRDAIDLARQLKPNVVVMDYAMPELDGLQATHEIRRQVPEAAVLIVSMHSDPNYVRNALDAGARGYLLKSEMEEDLADAVKKLAAGGTIGVPAPPQDPDEDFNKLTPREKQVLQLIAQGQSNKDIAQLLGLSVNTVSVHRANLMEALKLHKTAELVLYAIRKGLVTPP